MTTNQIENIIKFHKLACKLKMTVRTGWKYWNVKEDRLESVAEHVYGACMLAIGIFSTVNMKLDMYKVITMIVLHDTEEILIGDITMFDSEKLATKKEEGRKAVLEIFKNFHNAEEFLSLIEEFELNQTKEAIFAHQIDKLEADLQAEYYSESVDYNGINPQIFAHPEIEKYTKMGCKTLGEYFLKSDKHKFSGECLEIADYIEKNKI